MTREWEWNAYNHGVLAACGCAVNFAPSWPNVVRIFPSKSTLWFQSRCMTFAHSWQVIPKTTVDDVLLLYVFLLCTSGCVPPYMLVTTVGCSAPFLYLFPYTGHSSFWCPTQGMEFKRGNVAGYPTVVIDIYLGTITQILLLVYHDCILWELQVVWSPQGWCHS